jgi:hypothetical protein
VSVTVTVTGLVVVRSGGVYSFVMVPPWDERVSRDRNLRSETNKPLRLEPPWKVMDPAQRDCEGIPDSNLMLQDR